MIVAAAVAIAGVAQVCWSLWALRASDIRWVRPTSEALPALHEILRKAGPMILGLGVLQLNTFVDGLIASWPSTVGPTIAGFDYPLDAGALAALGYAQRLYEFPLGVFGIAVATAIFPLLSKQSNDPPMFLDTLRRGLRLVVFIGLPASAGLMVAGAPLTATLLQGGDFDASDTRRVAFVLLGYAPAVWAYSMNHTLTRAMYALGDTMTPVRISVGMVALNLVLNVTLICTPLREAGLAWSTAFCAILQSLLLLRATRRKVDARMSDQPPIVDAAVRRSWLRTAVASAIMVAVVGVVLLVSAGAHPEPAPEPAPEHASWGRQAIRLLLAVGVGAGVFAGLARVMRMPELHWALGRRGERRA